MQISLSHYSFEISEPFAPGQTIGKTESEVLNNVRAENIREAIRREYDRLLRSHGSHDGILDEQGLAALQLRAKAIDAEYQFKPRPQSKVKSGSLAAELRTLAEEQVESLQRSGGYQLPEGEYEVEVAKLVGRTDLIAEATRRLRAKLETAKAAIEDML